jgi:hypothetical protein
MPPHRRDFDDADAKQATASAVHSMDDHFPYPTPAEATRDIALADVDPTPDHPPTRLSVADLHRRCVALEDERRCLAAEIAERGGGGTAECRRLIERERAVIREIGSMLDRMQTAPVQSIDDIAALVDIALDIEFDAPSPDLILHERPWTLRLLHALRCLAPDVEMSWLRRQSYPRASTPKPRFSRLAERRTKGSA